MRKYKPKNSAPSLESIKYTGKYAFSFNPKTSDTNLKENYYLIVRILQHLDVEDWIVHFEVSPMGRLHIHGILVIENIPKFYCKTIPYLCTVGSFELDTIGEDPVIWMQYCVKQSGILKGYFEELGLKVQLKAEDKEWIKRYNILGSTIYEKMIKYSYDEDLEFDIAANGEPQED